MTKFFRNRKILFVLSLSPKTTSENDILLRIHTGSFKTTSSTFMFTEIMSKLIVYY